LAKPNYQYEKRQRDLAKKQKKEEKARQKLAGKSAPDVGSDQAGALPDSDSSTAVPPDSESATEA
jgi:hypothetical protein